MPPPLLTKKNVGKQLSLLIFPFAAFFVGKYLDDLETERMIRFRDRSALFGRTLAPGEKPSWP
ncbi:NADH dehydrogenase (ubiquinone) MNLL subunit [Lycorma delicatula]|uniref:NADH dehydrogenase (ubiquinone) MNLL subunit n=1 Tax=Lycorma delicatula TaxID=130591 RepID=UPI003F51ABC0